MARWIVVALAVASAAACKKNKPEGFKPAANWNAPQAGADLPGAPTDDPHGMQADNPHAGVDMGSMDNPHAGVDMGSMGNPHAGVDMGGGGTDVGSMGLPPPDPNRKIDPSHHVSGVISVHPKAKDKVPSGGIIFVNARKADANGQPTGFPVAVAKLTYTGGDIPFDLTENQEMVGNAGDLSGDVIVSARYDQDGDAMSKQPGDVTGSLRVKVPADHVKIYLDTILP